MGSMTGMFGGARPSHRLQEQVDEPHPHAHTQARDDVPNQTPIASVTLLQGQRFQVQALPADTDPNYKIDIIVSGKIGYHLASTRRFMSKLRVEPYEARVVDNAPMPLDDILVDNLLAIAPVRFGESQSEA
ncbi:hypothetical protein GY45DRAFT_1324302 [Cubamyces sp. BRFM 1775]|nr:hypothetical protein GY45DRAFT_1324302 [Cubamyces sp. BRFM 1775]